MKSKKELGEFEIRIWEKRAGEWMCSIQYRDFPPMMYGDKEPFETPQDCMKALIRIEPSTPCIEKATQKPKIKKHALIDDSWMD